MKSITSALTHPGCEGPSLDALPHRQHEGTALGMLHSARAFTQTGLCTFLLTHFPPPLRRSEAWRCLSFSRDPSTSVLLEESEPSAEEDIWGDAQHREFAPPFNHLPAFSSPSERATCPLYATSPGQAAAA